MFSGTKIIFLKDQGSAKKDELHTFYDPILIADLIYRGVAVLAVNPVKDVQQKLVNLIASRADHG